MFLDRKTSEAALLELSSWQAASRLRVLGAQECVVASSIEELAFPRDVQRGGRHPRHAAGMGGAPGPGPARSVRPQAVPGSGGPERGLEPPRLEYHPKLASIIQMHNG